MGVSFRPMAYARRMPDALRFHFDVVSPYAYLGWTQIHALAGRHGRAVEPVAVLFAGVLNHHGQKGPAEIPAKRAYVFKDVARKARRLGVPLAPPPTHPFNPLLALRIASLPLSADDRRRAIDALFTATWATGAGVETAEAVIAALDGAGLAGAELVARAGAADAKQRLRDQTDAAIAAGVFGVPTVIADGEVFWGVDAFDLIDDFLAGRDPIRGELPASFANLRPSATR